MYVNTYEKINLNSEIDSPIFQVKCKRDPVGENLETKARRKRDIAACLLTLTKQSLKCSFTRPAATP